MSVFALMAGGTGGHLFAAQALAEELLRRGHRAELVTDERAARISETFPPRAIHVVPSASPNPRRPLAAVAAGGVIVYGLAVAFGVLRRIEADAVVGFGGYPSFPPFLAAALMGIPGLLHEQNAVMGRANRALARFADALALSFEKTRGAERFSVARRVTGNPVRAQVMALAGTEPLPTTNGGALRVLVFGGSQGARFLSEVVPGAVIGLPAELRDRIAVTQQCREEDLERVTLAYAEARIDVELAAFFADLPERIAGSHLVIARAGASTVAELAVIGRPAILIPLPGSLDQDQLANATVAADAGGALVLDQATISPQSLASELAGLLAQPQRLATMASSMQSLGRPDAASRLADLATELAAPRAPDEGVSE